MAGRRSLRSLCTVDLLMPKRVAAARTVVLFSMMYSGWESVAPAVMAAVPDAGGGALVVGAAPVAVATGVVGAAVGHAAVDVLKKARPFYSPLYFFLVAMPPRMWRSALFSLRISFTC